MRDPRFWRNFALAFFATGAVAAAAAFFLPNAAANDIGRGTLFIYGVMALLFGGGSALFRQFDVRAKDALARGEDIIARWRIDAGAWGEFVALNYRLSQRPGSLPNELSIRDGIPGDRIEVIAGKTAVQIDDSIHVLPRRGTPEITRATLDTSNEGLTYIEFQLYYPGGGSGVSGVPHLPRRALLRFPVAAGSLRDAEDIVAYYESGRPGNADFFHGAGDGGNPEDRSRCYACGFETDKFLSHCPRCGVGLQSKRWSRRFGYALFVCGLIITGLMGTVIFYTAPLMLRPGVEVHGTKFSGTAGQGTLFLGIMGLVATFGTTAMLYGVWQIATGRRDKRAIYFIAGLAIVLWLIAIWIR